ncbi:hypothetical protein H0H93_010207 [Arthromyces matolae]|nr:hypothetical protein H0H93_010207 [Arthromyces matolae]
MSTSVFRMNQAARPDRWKSTAPAAPHGTETFVTGLPKLPVPDLSNTLTRLKQSLLPMAWSDEEYASVSRKIDQLAAGLGPELQRRLLSRAAETRHWLEDWWDDGGYLGYRDSVVVNVSYYYGFDEQPSHLPQTPAARAAGLARATMIFRQNLKKGLLKPDGTKEGPFCMDTYRWMFDCCRVPGPDGLDWSVSYAKEGDSGNSGHIVVFRNNRVWRVEAAVDGRILSTAEFEKQIRYIYENSDGEYPGVGVLTASNRDVWAKDYKILSESGHNAQILSAIQSAAFVISLEGYNPATPIEHSRALWHGSVTNGVPIGLRTRWVDKPVEYIVYDNAVAGLMGEHSVMDGTPTVRLCDDVLDMLADPSFDHGSSSVSSTLIPTPLDWETNPSIIDAIAKADAAAIDLIDSQELGYLLTPYGKAAIKKFGVSPDSWAQMIVQLAYRRLIGDDKRIGGTYEAATTRKFDKGRTEAIRVVSNESDAWVASMDDPKVSNDHRKRLFMAAAKRHIELAKSAGIGQGLKKLVKEGEEVPELFSDPVFLRSNYWVLSTSAIFSKHFPVYGWGEVVPDGFGVAYMTGYDGKYKMRLQKISCNTSPQKRLAENVPRTLDNMREFDPSILTANPNQAGPSSSQDDRDEAAADIANDPFASYFNSEDDPSIPPKILITTSPKASKATYDFCDELVGVFPGAEFIRRKKGKGFEIGRIAGWAAGRQYKHLLVVNEDMKKPNAVTLVYLPHGPSAYFKLTSVELTKNIFGHARATPHHPELVLNGFVTRLGHTTGRLFQTMFPPLPEFQGRQVVTLHNQRDFLFFRRHRYAFRSTEKVALQEIGPRFTLKLRSLRKGIPAVLNFGEAPKPLEFDVGPFEETEEKAKNEDAPNASNSEKPQDPVVPPKADEYLWEWKPQLETTRRTFFL